jgi:hypothetical protein
VEYLFRNLLLIQEVEEFGLIDNSFCSNVSARISSYEENSFKIDRSKL